jgi:prepilin-type N-terminal cleavage/methylation domain-containing protein
MRRARGFTIIELMVVVTIIGVIASIAIVSMRKRRSTGDADQWANALRNLAQQARRRAVSTGTTYLLDVRQKTARWCQVDDVLPCNSNTTTTSTCPNSTATRENGGLMYAPADAVTDSGYGGADVTLPGQTYAAPTHATMSSTASFGIYFGPTGIIDTNYCNANTTNLVMSGATLYVKANNTVASATSQNQKRRRIVLFGVSGRPRIIDNW